MIYNSNVSNIIKLSNGYEIYCYNIILYFPENCLISCNRKGYTSFYFYQ